MKNKMKNSYENCLRRYFMKVPKRFFSSDNFDSGFYQKEGFVLTNGGASYSPEFLGPVLDSRQEGEEK